MTQRQQQIIEDYLFDVFVKLEGNGEKSENWWKNVFLLEAVTNMGLRDYKISDFCEPSDFFKDDEAEEKGDSETESETDDDEDRDTDDDSTYDDVFAISKRHEPVDNYLENYYQHENYYWVLFDLRAMNVVTGGSEHLLLQQYLYVYTLENSDYFMNKFIYGDVVMLK